MKISIFVKIFDFVIFLKKILFGHTFRKMSILVKITVISQFSSKFMNISIFVKIFDNRDFGQNVRKFYM